MNTLMSSTDTTKPIIIATRIFKQDYSEIMKDARIRCALLEATDSVHVDGRTKALRCFIIKKKSIQDKSSK
jgi:hypothetical protein